MILIGRVSKPPLGNGLHGRASWVHFALPDRCLTQITHSVSGHGGPGRVVDTKLLSGLGWRGVRGCFPCCCSWHMFAAWLHADPYKISTCLEQQRLTLKIWPRLLFCLSALDMSISHTLITEIHTQTWRSLRRKPAWLNLSVAFWRGLKKDLNY